MGTKGFGLDPPTNRLRQTEPHRIMAQSVYGPKIEIHNIMARSTDPIIFIYKLGPNMLPQPDKRHNV